MGLRREFLIKGIEDKLVKAYYDYMVDIAVIFGAEKERASTELMDSLLFEIQLANVRYPSFFITKKLINVADFFFVRYRYQARNVVTRLLYIIR